MNVIGSRPDGWWRDRHGAMTRLVAQLDRFAAESGDEVTVVFEQPPTPPIASHRVAVVSAPAPRPNSADDEIVRRVELDPEAGGLTVVTSDGALATRVRKAGAAVRAAAAFRARLEQDAR